MFSVSSNGDGKATSQSLRRKITKNATIALALSSGLLWSVPSATNVYAASQGTESNSALLQAWTNTSTQPVLQISGASSFDQTSQDTSGKTQEQKESVSFSAQFEADNGGYDELLKETTTGAYGGDSLLYIQSDGTFYYQDGASWDKGGQTPSNTMQEEPPLIQNMDNVTASPSASGAKEYSGTLNAKEIISLIDNYVMAGQAGDAYDALSDHILNESKSEVTVDTGTFNGNPVVDDVKVNITVALSMQDTLAVMGYTGDTSKVQQPETISMDFDYVNTFNQTTFPSPITGQTPSEKLVSVPANSGTNSGSSSSSTSSNSGSSSSGSTKSSSGSSSRPGGSTSTSSGSASQVPAKPVHHVSAADVTRAYQEAFGRNPYSNEIAKWTAVDDLDYTSLMAQLRTIIRTDAGTRKSNTMLVYTNAFGRSPTADELKWWDIRLKDTGEDYVEQIEILRGQIRADRPTQQEIITKSYQAVFWRGPTADEMKYWTNRLQRSGEDYQELVTINQASFHELQSMREGAVTNAYLVYFGTNPSASQLNYWSNETKSQKMTSYAQLIQWMDPSLRHTIKTDQSVRQAIITSSYWTVFWRGPNPDEMKYWDNQLKQSGANFQELMNAHIAFLKTNEAMRTAAINNAHMVWVGRNATATELSYWSKLFQNGAINTYQDLVSKIQSTLKENSALQADVINRAYEEAFGRSVKPDEVTFWETYFKSGQVNYSELVKLHRDYIKKDAVSRKAMITTSYEAVFHRAPTSGEFSFWDNALKQYGDTYDELVTAHRNWLKANQSALDSNRTLESSLAQKNLKFDPTTGSLLSTKTGQVVYQSGHWTIAQLDKNGNLIGIDGTGVIAAGGGNVIAAGGGNVIAAGGGNVIAAGGGNVIAAGGGNVIAAGGGNVIAAGGGNVIAAGGANMIKIDGGAMLNPGLIALQNGASVIAAGGANVIAAGGGN